MAHLVVDVMFEEDMKGPFGETRFGLMKFGVSGSDPRAGSMLRRERVKLLVIFWHERER